MNIASRLDPEARAASLAHRHRLLLGAAGAVLSAALALPAAAQTGAADQTQDKVVSDVIVTGARNLTGVIQKRDSSLAFGIDKPLVETPRSVTTISDQLLDRYNIKTVYDFTAVAAGTYTGSYFGVPGSLNIRGTVADIYFNGFEEITNYATYPTPVDASASIDLVRGPASPAYGAGQIGGYMNFTPKSAHGNTLSGPTGAMSATFGSYNEKEFSAEGGVPFTLGGNQAGIYAYAKGSDSDSFYLGEHPKSATGQLTFNTDLGPDWSLSASAQMIWADGYLKDIGWNRVSQALIDHGTYQAGTAIAPLVQPGEKFITLADVAAANAKAPAEVQQYVLPLFHVFAKPTQYTTLDPATTKLVQLSPRVTDLSSTDVNRASTPIFYLGLNHTIGDFGTLKLESFSQYLDALNYQSYGFATIFRTLVNEERISYTDKHNFGPNIATQTVIGASYRYTNAYSAEYLLSGANVQDRWDLSGPQTSDMIFNAVFGSSNHGNYTWDNATLSRQTDAAVFLVEDVLLFDHFDVTGGVRDDNYSLKSSDVGVFATANGAPTRYGWYTQTASPISWNLSVSLKNPYVVPYYTYAENHSLNVDQGDAVIPALTSSQNAIGDSSLSEVGLKTTQLNGRFYAAIDFYRQENEYLAAHTFATTAELGQGFEGEVRWLVTKQLGLTGTVTDQHVHQLGAGAGSGPFMVITPQEAGITGVQGYGGQFETNAEFLGMKNGYNLHTTPRISSSLFATWDQGGKWGLTGGFTYNSETGGSIANSIRLPAYTLLKVGAYAMVYGVRADLYIDNATDQRYFLAEYDVDNNATVLPGVGREFHFKLSKKF